MPRALIIIPCSCKKVISPRINYHQNVNPLNGVVTLRQNLLNILQQDINFVSNIKNQNGILNPNSPTTIACELYNGKMYSKIKKIIHLIAQFKYPEIHILILSALYGIVQLNEQLKMYDLTMGTDISNQSKSNNKVYKIWKRSNISDFVLQYIISHEIENVWSLLPNSGKTIYHSILVKLWKNLTYPRINSFHVFPGKEKNQCAGLYRGLWLGWILKEYINGGMKYIMNNPTPPNKITGINTKYDYRNCV